MDEFQQTILRHYEENPRHFRWRETTDPYEILVSEIMLQQTQTERVVPKYNLWLEKFPTAQALSAAPFPDVLLLWNGLGYNRRARFLQETCKIICRDFNGIFPKTAEKLDALPGIGPYTARAVTTFAFNKPEIFIETNIRSVFIFFFFLHLEEKVSDSLILPLVEKTLLQENPRIWYYALMDYGSSLKKKIKNPNRKSAGYVKQSKFEGSVRQARGAVLRNLLTCREAALEQIAAAESLPYDRIFSAAESLCAEGFIHGNNGVYRICNSDIDIFPYMT